MTTNKVQSAIRELLDQISLDYADGKYLNIVTDNLGVSRPAFGFTDDLWRAVAKAVALRPKLIRTTFEEVLSILFGPKITEAATLKEASAVADRFVLLNSSEFIPQLGTLVFDEGLSTEETLSYCLINRTNNEVFLDDALMFAHVAMDFDAEQPILAIGDDLTGTLTVVVPDSNLYPVGVYAAFPDSSATLLLGRGRDSEEVVRLGDNNVGRHSLFPNAVVNTHDLAKVGFTKSTVDQQYEAGSYELVLADVTQFPDSGTALLSATDEVFTANAGSTEFILEVDTDLFVTAQLVGFRLVFSGNLTAALANEEVIIVDNSDTRIAVTEMSVAPADGDEFSIRPIVVYTSVDIDNSSLELRRPIYDIDTAPANRTLPLQVTVPLLTIRPPTGLPGDLGTVAEILETRATAKLAPAQFKGSGWDVFDTAHTKLDLFIPQVLADEGNLFSASYWHPFVSPGTATTLDAAATPGDTFFEVVDGDLITEAGVYLVDGDLVMAVRRVIVTKAGDTTLPTIIELQTDANNVLVAGAHVGEPITFGAYVGAVTANTATTITVTPAMVSFPYNGQSIVLRTDFFDLSEHSDFAGVHAPAVAVTVFEPTHPSGEILLGDFNQDVDTFPGPYVYDGKSDIPTVTTLGAATTLDVLLQGPVILAIDQYPGFTALELEDAIGYQLLAVPFTAIVGPFTNNREELQVDRVSVARRAITDLAVAGTPLDLLIEVSDLVGAGSGSLWPNASGFRIRIGRGTPTEEIVYVESVNFGTSELTLKASTPLQGAHLIGAVVELENDVFTVGTLTDAHLGVLNPTVDATDLIPTRDSARVDLSELVSPSIVDMPVALAAAFPEDGGNVILNFAGNQGDSEFFANGGAFDGVLPVGDVTLNVDAAVASALPSVFPFLVSIEPNALKKEVCEVIAKGPTTLIIRTPTTLSHYSKDVFLGTATAVTAANMLEDTGIGTLLGLDSLLGFQMVVRPGTLTEEVVEIAAYAPGSTEFTFVGPLALAPAIGDAYTVISGEGVQIAHKAGTTQTLNYDSKTGNTLEFSPGIMVQSTHNPGESVLLSTSKSVPSENGSDFPLRLPPDTQARLDFLFDLIRAAGVEVKIINKR